MPHVPSPLTPQEVAALRAILAARGRHGEPAAPEGLTILGRARDIVPTAVERDDDSLLFLTPEGAIVVGAVRDDGAVTYMRLDLANNLHVVDMAAGIHLVNFFSEMTENIASTDAVASELSKLTASGIRVETYDDTITVDLGAARAIPGAEILTPEGASVAGSSLTIQALGGTAIIRFNYASTTLDTLLAAQYGTLEFVLATQTIIRTVGNWTVTGSAMYSRPGTQITIAGSASNDGTYTVVSATATNLVVAAGLVNEAASATETVTGLYPKRAPTWLALAYPNMVTFANHRFSKVYVENVAQVGLSMTLVVGAG